MMAAATATISSTPFSAAEFFFQFSKFITNISSCSNQSCLLQPLFHFWFFFRWFYIWPTKRAGAGAKTSRAWGTAKKKKYRAGTVSKLLRGRYKYWGGERPKMTQIFTIFGLISGKIGKILKILAGRSPPLPPLLYRPWIVIIKMPVEIEFF